jgi:hypothetical protein
MKPWRNKLLLLGGSAALAALAIPASSQSTPESLLPPGFGDPEPAPQKEEPREEPVPEAGELAGETNSVETPPAGVPADVLPVEDSAAQDLEQLRPTRPSYTYDVPDGARRPTDIVGVLGPGNWGLGAGAFGTANGAYLATLMRRLEAPLPSRWTSMLLRRALMSRVPAPRTVHPVDWVAERAALLLRMGEADAARSLVQAVDVSNFTPRMVQVAFDTALATSDPAALCPLIEPGRRLGEEQLWRVADSVCAALAGEAARASALIDQARAGGSISAPDLLLAEKVIGAGTDTRRAVDVEWDEVDGLTPWRFGLASATGMEIPERLLAGGGTRMQAWHARSPMVPVEQRLASARVAAALGVFSSSALVEMYSLMFDSADPAEVTGTPAGRLRIAFAHRDAGERLGALRNLWDIGENPLDRYAQLILTAAPSAGLPPSAEMAEHADELIGAMLSAGLDDEAARWSDVVAAGDAGQRAWALLALGGPQPPLDPETGISAFQSEDDSESDLRTQLLVAALTGLGRMGEAEGAQLLSRLGVDLGREDRWTRALDSAVRARQPGTVALLAAVGLQTGDWSGVPAAHMYRIVRALRLAGLEFEARMIAAEALTRL